MHSHNLIQQEGEYDKQPSNKLNTEKNYAILAYPL